MVLHGDYREMNSFCIFYNEYCGRSMIESITKQIIK